MRFCLGFLLILSQAVFALRADDVLILRNQALNALPGFNPGVVISGYTQTPPESDMKPGASGDLALKNAGQSKMVSDNTAQFVLSEAQQRAKITHTTLVSQRRSFTQLQSHRSHKRYQTIIITFIA